LERDGQRPRQWFDTQAVFTLQTNSTLTWNWQATAICDIATNGAGTVTRPMVSRAGSVVPPHRDARGEYRFDHWAGDVPAPLVFLRHQPDQGPTARHHGFFSYSIQYP